MAAFDPDVRIFPSSIPDPGHARRCALTFDRSSKSIIDAILPSWSHCPKMLQNVLIDPKRHLLPQARDNALRTRDFRFLGRRFLECRLGDVSRPT
jgi:hypothetical protein